MLAQIMQTTLKASPNSASVVEGVDKMRQETIGGLWVEGNGHRKKKGNLFAIGKRQEWTKEFRFTNIISNIPAFDIEHPAM